MHFKESICDRNNQHLPVLHLLPLNKMRQLGSLAPLKHLLEKKEMCKNMTGVQFETNSFSRDHWTICEAEPHQQECYPIPCVFMQNYI